MIKLVDLAAQNREIQAEVEAGLAQVHERTAYIGGPAVAAFEQEFAKFLGVARVVGVGSGTDALRLALMAAGVEPGHEVITVPLTFIATIEAVVQLGARPVFVDVDPTTATMSPDALEAYLARGRWAGVKGPRAILPVHLYGLPAAMDRLATLAKRYDLAVIEDACQAHGATLGSGTEVRAAGNLGHAGCFSFYPGKNLGGWGDGGAVATNDEEWAGRIAQLRDHGRISHYAHQDYGFNARLDTVQAVVLRAKLARLAQWNEHRARIAGLYARLLGECGDLRPPCEPPGYRSAWHLYAVRCARRDSLRQALLSAGVECGIHYPVPLHLQPACRGLGYRSGDFPVSEAIADTTLSLPMHPHLSEAEVERVAAVTRACLAQG